MDKMKNVPMIEARNIVFCEYYTRGMVGEGGSRTE